MDPSSTSPNSRQPKHSGTRQLRPADITRGVRKYVYEAARIALDVTAERKTVTTVKLSTAEVELFERLAPTPVQHIWSAAFEHFESVRNNVIVEQLRLYGIKNIRRLLADAHQDHTNQTEAHVLLGDVERWAFYYIYQEDTQFLAKLASAKTPTIANPYLQPNTHELLRRHGELLSTYSFRPKQSTPGPRTSIGLFCRYALHARYSTATNFKLPGKLYYPASDEWEMDPFGEIFPSACDPDIAAHCEEQFEASLKRDLPESLHEKARARWREPTWEQLRQEYDVCNRFGGTNDAGGFAVGRGVIALTADNLPIEPMPTPAGFRRKTRKSRSPNTLAATLADGPGRPALARSQATPHQPPPPADSAPPEAAQDAETMLRDIFASMEL